MKSRIPVLVVALVLAGLAGALAASLSAPMAAVAIAAVIGAVVGATLGQSLMWLRATAGRAARIEHVTQHRLEGMRQIAEKRHEILVRALRETRERATNAERQAGRAAAIESKVDAALKGALRQQREDARDMRLTIEDKLDDQVVLLEDYMQLLRLVPMNLPMPRPGTWAASEDLLLWLAGFVLEHRPRVVVDLGSGQSSVWMAAAMRTAGHDGMVIGVDHDEQYAEATRELARRQGVERWLRVIHAPLREQDIAGRTAPWYDLESLADLTSIDLLSVDGPPGKGVPQSRWPALPALRDRLAPGATVVLDDMIRRDEQDILEDWMSRYPEVEVSHLDFEKGAAVLTVR